MKRLPPKPETGNSGQASRDKGNQAMSLACGAVEMLANSQLSMTIGCVSNRSFECFPVAPLLPVFLL